ncbi:MAG: hypothetical protein AB7P20_02030 [Rhizobiaceae bacterium]
MKARPDRIGTELNNLDSLLRNFDLSTCERAIALQLVDTVEKLIDPATRCRFEFILGTVRQLWREPDESSIFHALNYFDFVRLHLVHSESEKQICFVLWGALPRMMPPTEEEIRDWCYEVIEIYLENGAGDVDQFYDDARQRAEAEETARTESR